MATSSQIGRLGGLGSVAHAPLSQSAERAGRTRRGQAARSPVLPLRSAQASSLKLPQLRSGPVLKPQHFAAGGCLQLGCSKLGFSAFTGLALPAVSFDERLVRERQDALHVVSEAGVADEQDRGERQEPISGFSKEMMVPTSMAKIGTQFGGGSATLERGKLDLSKEAATATPKVDDGSGGGNKGKDLNNGGGDGGDDGGDDDDYFDDFDDDGDGGDDGFFGRRTEIVELFDRETIEAVLQEWYRTVTGLPSGVRRAVEMGMVSSAQLVRLLNTDCRPTIARAVTRHTPPDFARAFLGRLMADPAFFWKLGLEQAFTIGNAAYWEIKQRGSRLKDEWDLAVVNVLTLAAANAVINWTVAPCRKYHEPFRWEWQNTLQKLPHNAFDKSYKFAELSKLDRFYGFAYKSAELCAIGSVLGSVGGLVQNALVTVRQKIDPKFRPSVAVPSVGVSSLGYGAFMGLSGNLRYQLIGGLERFMGAKYSNLGFITLVTTAARFSNVRLGEPTRLHWLGMDSGAAAFRRKSAAAGGLLDKAGAFFKKKGVKMTVKGKGKGKGKLKAKASPAPATQAPEAPQEPKKPRYRVRKRPELQAAAA